ncbi:MgtC/SapB family protein [Haloarcula amylovorans]|uniref:MgtC/SapB family protein n=1 Tax=Haloarcula amylovorans TaxID=2562280 RepID=UPI001075D5D8|nr:MgtC/SapB family protein [Halomicroarcula amylolytica]
MTLIQLASSPGYDVILNILLAGALGMFLGLEREWSQKSAGIRTFALISLLAAVFTLTENSTLLIVGGILVITQGVLLAIQGLMADEDRLSLTTSVSMLVAYGVGSLAASGARLEAVTVAVISSLLLVLKRELHSFAWGLSREEVRSATEFAIIAFVVYPLLPPDPVSVPRIDVTLELRTIWLMVVFVAGIGILNYAVVQSYGGRGIAITGFFGGLASSTAVVGTMMDHVKQRPEASSYAVAAILLADAAMALRNLLITVLFTINQGVLVEAVVPLGAVIVGSVVVAAYTADWSESIEMDLDSPFSMQNALTFGGVFLLVVVAGGVASARFGTAGLYVTSAISGLVSSAGATTSAVLLYRSGTIQSEQTAMIAILIATASSIVVKAALTAPSPNRRFATQVAIWSSVVLGGASLMAVALLM